MATQLLANGATAAVSATQTIADHTRHMLMLQSTAADPLAAVEIQSDTGEYVHHLMLSDLTDEARTAELFGPLSYRVRRPAGFGACSVWNDQ